MKLCLAIFLASCTFYATAQEYIPFPDSTATWNVDISSWDDFGENGQSNGHSYHLEGDTIVNNLSYSKLYMRLAWNHSYGAFNVGTPNEYTFSHHENYDSPYILIGGIREDENKKVWYQNLNFDNWWDDVWMFAGYDTILVNEILLYDFGMEIGDTLVTYPFDYDWPTELILEEITVDILGRNNFVFGTEDTEYGDGYIWIEGLGNHQGGPFSRYHFVGNSLGFHIFLTCFSENNELIYHPYNSMYANCEGTYSSGASLAHPYIPFPDSTALWNVVNTEVSENGDYGGILGINYKLEGDTIIDDVDYSKVYTRLSWGSEWNPDGQGYEILEESEYAYELIGAIREDDDKKIWFKNISMDDWWTNVYGNYMIGYDLTINESIPSEEFLLHDFGLSIGDSAEFLNADMNLEYYVLDDIFIGAADRRNFTYVSSEGMTEVTWAEGMGGFTHGFFAMFSNPMESNAHLACYSVNGQEIYTQPSESYVDLEDCEGPGLDIELPECGSTISGHVFLDLNNNGIMDDDESPLQYPLINTNDESYSVGDIDGRFIDCVDPGTANINVVNVPQYYSSAPSNYGIDIGIDEIVEDIDFALSPIPGINDLSIETYAPTPDRPGFDNYYVINYANIGTECIENVSISFTSDELITILNVAGGNSQDFTESTATISLETLCPGQSGQIIIEILISLETEIDDILVSQSTITPTVADENVFDNSFIFESVVVGSFDPNDKAVDYEFIDSTFIAEQNKITYLIRFQNTGNYYAENVVVTDVIDDDLILESFELVNTSHPVQVIFDGNELSFNFPNIFLPSEDDDEEGSNGYVRFKIQPTSNFSEADVIENTASIYFDFNEPIITNTVNTSWLIPDGISEFEVSNILVYPNPFKDIIQIQDNNNHIHHYNLYDAVGRLILSGELVNKQISTSSIESGLYEIELIDRKENKVISRKIIKI